MPGTNVTVSARPGPPAVAAPPEACLFIPGLVERGPTDGFIELRSLGDFARLCGDPQPFSWAYHAVRTHFEDGGAFVRLARLVGPAATVGGHVFVDRAGAPAPTLQIVAASEGAWSTRVSVQIRDGVLDSTFDVLVLLDGQVVETFRTLASPAAAVAALANSAYVRGVDQGSATAAPNNNPAVAAPTALSAGNDDRAALAAGDFVAALNTRFPPEVGTGVVAVPGFDSSQVGEGVRDHCAATGRNAYLATPVGTDEQGAKDAAKALVGPGGEHLALAWPWVLYTDEAGVQHTVPPEGFVAAGRTSAIVEEGVWRAAAGSITRSVFLDGVETVVTGAVGDDLDASHVTVIRVRSGRPEVFGARSLAVDTDNWDLFKYRDLTNKIAFDLEAVTEDLEFATIDQQGRYFASLRGRCAAYLQPLADAGALYPGSDSTTGVLLDPGWSVDTSATVNPPAQLAAGRAAASVGFRPSPSATMFDLMLVKAAFTASV